MSTCSFEIWWIPLIVYVAKSSLHPILLYRATKYTDLCNELIYRINYSVTIDVKLLLKGSDTLSVDQNIDIVIKVQNFILKNKRFTS
jgi:hypothetical protein